LILTQIKIQKKVESVGNKPDSKLIISSSKGKISNYKLVETGNSTGIFQGIIGLVGVFKNGKIKSYKLGNRTITKTQGKGHDNGFLRAGRGDELLFSYRSKSGTANLTAFVTDFGATIELDQKKYTWTDKVFITVLAPDFNFNSKRIDTIGNSTENKITISSSKGKIKNYKLVETGTDTGIFTGEITLTGFQNSHIPNFPKNKRFGKTKGDGPSNGLLATSNDDFIEVALNYFGEEIIIGRALIGWNIGEITWSDKIYLPDEVSIIRVIDPDMNLNPSKIDSFTIHVWSDSDLKGIDLPVYETGESTGIFEGKVVFNKSVSSNDGRLKVTEGDNVHATYIDYTLPKPYSKTDQLELKDSTKIQAIKVTEKDKASQIVEHIVKIPLGSGVPGCEETNECYIPSILKIKKGDTVVWLNEDTAAHLATSGTADDVESIGSLFDSGLFMTGQTFKQKFEIPGQYDYFCMVHPWQVGTVIVEDTNEDNGE